MKKLFIAFFATITVFSSCNSAFMEGMMYGLSQYGNNSTYNAYPYASQGYYVPTANTYSSDPCVNASIAVANSTQQIQSYGVNTGTSQSTSNKSSRKSSSSSIYDCCSRVPNFGLESYHNCPNCGKRHLIGTHSCVKK